MKRLLLFAAGLLLYAASSGQEADPEIISKRINAIRKINSLKTNVLAEILQASVENGVFSSTENNVQLKSTIFGFRKIFDRNADVITIDTNYARAKFARNFEIAAGVPITDENKISGFTAGIKYAIINNRDLTEGQAYAALNPQINALTEHLKTLGDVVQEKIRAQAFGKTDAAEVLGILQEFTATQNDAVLERLSKFEVFDQDFLATYRQRKKAIDAGYQNISEQINKGALLTFSANTAYNEKNWSNVFLKLEYLKGLGNVQDETKPWDIYASVDFNIEQDSALKQGLDRNVFNLKFGLNKVLLRRTDGNSLLEMLGAAEYNNPLKGAYADEAATFLANFTVTARISKSLFLPIEIKWDPKNGNVFGFLNIKWDFLRTTVDE